MKDESVYFDGDPAIESSRRHMERVLKGEPGPSRWPWLVAAVAGGGLFALWRAAGQAGQGVSPAGTRTETPASGKRQPT